MHADLGGAARVARSAANFNWTWSRDDVSRFADEMGWHITRSSKMSATLATDISIDRPVAKVGFGGVYAEDWNDCLADLTVYIADLVAPSGKLPMDAVSPERIYANFEAVVNAVWDELGEPSGARADYPGGTFHWNSESVVVSVEAVSGIVSVTITDPRVWEWLNNISEEDDFE